MLANCPPSPVLRVPNISYLNLCLIVKFAYTGEVTMAETRLAGFIRDAKALGLFKAPDDFAVTQKPRHEIKGKQKRARSKVNITTANKRAAEEDLQADECKKRKQEASEGECSENFKTRRVEPDVIRKRKPSAEEALIESWDRQTPKRSRVAIISCQICFQSFSDIHSLTRHQAFCNFKPPEGDSDDFDDFDEFEYDEFDFL